MFETTIMILICWAIFGLIIGVMAKWKNRNGLLWGVIGGPFLVLGLLIVTCMPFLCPKCRKIIKRKQWKENICSDCGSNLKTGGKVFKVVYRIASISAVSIVLLVLAFALIMSQSSEKSSKNNELEAYDSTEAYNPALIKEIADKIKEEAVQISYDDLARYPDEFKKVPVHLTGKIVQKLSSDQFRVDITRDEFFWKDTIYVFLQIEAKLLEEDVVDFYGLANGTVTYETIVGSKMTIPRVDVYEIKLLKEVEEVAKPVEMDVKTIKANAVEVKYDDLARYPDKMKGKPVHITGKILFRISKDKFNVEITKHYEVVDYDAGFSYWEDSITIRLRTDARLLENDIVEFYGVVNGTDEDFTPLVDVYEINVIGKD